MVGGVAAVGGNNCNGSCQRVVVGGGRWRWVAVVDVMAIESNGGGGGNGW